MIIKIWTKKERLELYKEWFEILQLYRKLHEYICRLDDEKFKEQHAELLDKVREVLKRATNGKMWVFN